MIFARFEHLLKQAIGLDAASIGTSAVERAVRARARACGLGDDDRYWAHVSSSRPELQALVEAVVVPETWFFRDAQAFAALARLAAEASPQRPDGAPLRLLSLPCSTGEEPYTMAMALLDAGLDRASFRIAAIDISGPALGIARNAAYGRNSFRGDDLAYRERHFVESGQGWRLADAVRACVEFRQGNLFEAASDGETFDIVFCRNVLIYFDAQDQHRAIGVLRRLLAPAGTLFVGHSEASLLLDEGFASAKIPLAFAFRKAAAPVARRKPTPLWPDAAPTPAVRTPAVAIAAPPRRAAPAAPSAPDLGAALEEVRRAADRGDLADAVERGRACLRAHPASPDTLHLMGVLSEAAGDPKAAADYYRKALYLEPDREEVLNHLALLLEKQGDGAAAERMRARAHRLRARTGS